MPRQRTTVCSTAGCPNLNPCPDHPTGAWRSSTRRERIGTSGWQQQRDAARILRIHHGVCHWCGQPGADQVDHVIALAHGGDDTDSNKRPIHAKPCHDDKTAAERRQGVG